MTSYFALVSDKTYPEGFLLITSDNKDFINDKEGVQEKLEIKLEHDLGDTKYISLGIMEGIHLINVVNNLKQTLTYAESIFEILTEQGWKYVAEGVMLGEGIDIIFTESKI